VFCSVWALVLAWLRLPGEADLRVWDGVIANAANRKLKAAWCSFAGQRQCAGGQYEIRCGSVQKFSNAIFELLDQGYELNELSSHGKIYREQQTRNRAPTVERKSRKSNMGRRFGWRFITPATTGHEMA